MQPETNRLAKLLTGFVLSKQAEGCSWGTLHDYQAELVHLGRWMDLHGHHDPAALTTADLKGFLSWVRATPTEQGKLLSPKTIYNIWVALRAFYRWLAEETDMDSPMAKIPAPKTPGRVIDPLTREEVARMVKACDITRPARTTLRQSFSMNRDTASRDKAIILVLLDSGLRASELCSLTFGDVDLATGRIFVRSGKGGKGRIVYLGKVARRTLWRYLSKRDTQTPVEPLFLARTGRPLTGDRLDKLFKSLGERAAVSNLHPHRLRHTFATEFLRNGGNLLALQRLLGHASLEMVRRYAAIVEADLERAHQSGSPADMWRIT